MTYKTRQEVLRAAADWMDVCIADSVTAICKYAGDKELIANIAFDGAPELYEFPITLLEGKEVWIGSELYDAYGRCVKAEEFDIYENRQDLKTDGRWYDLSSYSWNPPNPKTVMVEMLVEDAEFCARTGTISSARLTRHVEYCKKALEKL